MEGKAMLAEQEAWACSGASWPVGEPVTLVIEEERFGSVSKVEMVPPMTLISKVVISIYIHV